MRVRFQLNGATPILFHQDDVELSDQLSEWRKDPANANMSKAGDDRSPPWTWQTYLYSDGEHVAIPSANLMVCLRQAGTQMILKKQKTFKEITQSGLLIATEFLRFTSGGNQIAMESIESVRDLTFSEQAEFATKNGFRLFVKRAKVGQSKHVRVRPRFDSWAIDGEIEVLVPEITYEALERLFELAGRVGLNDWRPGCRTPGPYGMFTSKLKAV